MGKVVLVTGVSGDFGRRFAVELTGRTEVDRVIGVDVLPPRGGIGPADFVRADIRNPVIAKVIVRERVDTVVHLAVTAYPGSAGGRGSMKELNVIGTMQLLAACQQAPDVESLVVRSSSSVYGSSSRDPALFTEGMSARRSATSGFAKDVTEVESYVRGFARRRPDVKVAVLRPAPLMGPSVRSAMTTYLRMPIVPTVLGFDARLQFLHDDDLLGAVVRATASQAHGTFNLAGEGILTMTQAVRRLGKPSVPVPSFAVSSLGSVVRQARVADFSPEQMAYLTFGRGLDTTAMREELGYAPEYSTAAAFETFAEAIAPGLLDLERVQDSVSGIATAAGSVAGSWGGDRRG